MLQAVRTRNLGRYHILIAVVCMHYLLLASGWKKAHQLHGQLKPLKVMFQVLSLNSEAVLQKAVTECYQPYSSC